MADDEERRLHQAIDFVGLRAQATAVGLIQLSIELRRAGVISGEAIDRIKDAIARDISLGCPRSLARREYEANVRHRLDRLFSGEITLSEEPPVPVPE